MALNTILAISTLLGTYDATETLQHNMIGGVMSASEASEHNAQYDALPEYRRMVLPESFAEFIAEIERDGIGSRSFAIHRGKNTLRLSESEPERITTVATVPVHNKKTLADELRQQLYRYQFQADHVYIDIHQGKYTVVLSQSSNFGTGVIGL